MIQARELQVLTRSGETLRDRMIVMERLCQRSNLNYFPILTVENEKDSALVAEYKPAYCRTGLVPAVFVKFKVTKFSRRQDPKDEVLFTTGYRHQTWGMPIITDDTMVKISRARTHFNPDELDAFFERVKLLHLVHAERLRLLNALLSEREALDLYMTLFRAAGLTQRKYYSLLPRQGERLSTLEHLSLLTTVCRSKDPWRMLQEFGRITDHLIQGIEPLHQNGQRIIFRLGVKR